MKEPAPQENGEEQEEWEKIEKDEKDWESFGEVPKAKLHKGREHKHYHLNQPWGQQLQSMVAEQTGTLEEAVGQLVGQEHLGTGQLAKHHAH